MLCHSGNSKYASMLVNNKMNFWRGENKAKLMKVWRFSVRIVKLKVRLFEFRKTVKNSLKLLKPLRMSTGFSSVPSPVFQEAKKQFLKIKIAQQIVNNSWKTTFCHLLLTIECKLDVPPKPAKHEKCMKNFDVLKGFTTLHKLRCGWKIITFWVWFSAAIVAGCKQIA